MWECEYWNNKEQSSVFFYGYSLEQARERAREVFGEVVDNGEVKLIYAEYID